MSKDVQFCPKCGGKNLDIERVPRDQEIWYYEDVDSDGERLEHPVEVTCDNCRASVIITDGAD